MRQLPKIFIVVMALLALSGCRLLSPAAATATYAPAATLTTAPPVAATTAAPTAAQLPSPTSMPLKPTQTATPFLPIQGEIGVKNFKLRSGPGFLFDTIALYPEYSKVQVLGRTPGSAWFYVTTPDQKAGWMKSDYITLTGNIDDLPFFGARDAYLVSGHVTNGAGIPQTKIGVIIFSALDEAVQDNTMTDENGAFYLYLPNTIKGNYTIGLNAYSCGSSAVDNQCNFLYGFPSAQSISIPQPDAISIEFVLPNL